MDWMKLGEVNPPEEMEVLLWNTQTRAQIGCICYDANGHILFVYRKGDDFPHESVSDYTHWCQIVAPELEE